MLPAGSLKVREVLQLNPVVLALLGMEIRFHLYFQLLVNKRLIDRFLNLRILIRQPAK